MNDVIGAKPPIWFRIVAVLEYAGGWAWGYVQAGHLVGYVEAGALADPA